MTHESWRQRPDLRSRVATLVGLLVALPACGLVLGQPPPPPEPPALVPELFEFVIVPLEGSGPEAERLARSMLGGPMSRELVEGSATLIAGVETPWGWTRLLEYQATGDAGEASCGAEVIDKGGSSWCRPLDIRLIPVVQGPITHWGPTGWNEFYYTFFEVTPDVSEVVATATDGTTYSIMPAAGIGYVAWKDFHGSLTLTALDAAGNHLGVAAVVQGAMPQTVPANK